MKIAIIGSGNIGSAIARGLAQGKMFKASDIICTDRSMENLEKIKKINPDFRISTKNIEAVKEADLILFALKPWLVEAFIEEIRGIFDYNRQIIISVAAGVTFKQLTTYLNGHSDIDYSLDKPTIFRIMPNIAIEVQRSMTFVAAQNASDEQKKLVTDMFNELGYTMLVEEHLMTAGTALASGGIAFAMRYIRASIEGGVELGFNPLQAQKIVLETMKGAVELLTRHNSNPETEIDKVTTPAGITIKGLNEMELHGFTVSVIQGLKACK